MRTPEDFLEDFSEDLTFVIGQDHKVYAQHGFPKVTKFALRILVEEAERSDYVEQITDGVRFWCANGHAHYKVAAVNQETGVGYLVKVDA